MESETRIDIELENNEEGSRETDNLIEDPLKRFRLRAKIVNETDEYAEDIFKMLFDKKEDDFIKFMTNVNQLNMPKLNCSDGYTTYLQYACRHGLKKVAKYLIDSGADLNAVCNNESIPPIFEAITRESLDIATYILEVDPKQLFMFDFTYGYNILHFIADYLLPSDDVLKFLKHILDKIDVLRVSGEVKEASWLLNDVNYYGKSPIHIAVDKGLDKVIIVFLENGVDMFRRNNRGECDFVNMAPNTIEEYFNRKITKDLTKKDNYIEFNYASIVPPECFEYNNVSKETSRLVYLSQFPDFRHLIKHPVVSTFIHLKWQKVKWMFHLSLLNYTIFSFLFTRHVLIFNEIMKTLDIYAVGFVISFSIMAVQMMYQCLHFRLKYLFQQPENWVEIILFLTVFICTQTYTSYYQQISSVAVFLTWTKLILFIGRYPKLSTQVEMYKRVSITFFKYLSCYSIFIIAFSLNFYILFRDSNPKSHPVTQTLLNVTITIYDTFVSLVDFKSESIPVDNHPVIGHVFVLMFLLLIVVVMLNLLNGLAVSDTQAIIVKSELVGLISRLQYIYFVECLMTFGGGDNIYWNLCKNICKFYGMPRIKVFNCHETHDKGKGDLVVSGDEMIPSVLKEAIQIKRKCSWETTEDKLQKLLETVIENQNTFLCDTFKSLLDRNDNTILTASAVTDG